MKKRIAIALVAGVLLLIASCSYPPEPVSQIDHYPVKAGNTWSYTKTFSLYNFRPLISGFPFRDTSYAQQVTVEALGQELLNDGMNAWKFRTTGSGSPVVGYNFYRQTRDAFLSVAYVNPWLVAPLQSSPIQYHYAGKAFGSIAEMASFIEGNPQGMPGLSGDSLIYETIPATAFLFPISVGREWEYRAPLPFLNWRIHKKVIGTMPLYLPAGAFSSYKIQWFWDTKNDGTWDPKMSGYDYITPQGLGKREFFLRDVAVFSDVSADTIALVDLKDEYSAILIHVRE